MVDWIQHFFRPAQIDDETLALDLIQAQGPDGQFLDSDHTYEHFRERWYPSLFDRSDYATWASNGGSTLLERACARVGEILAEHQPEPLPDDIIQALEAVIHDSL
ncbi:MAG: hypothetical protein D6775_13445 [Caldilineae bacterium]|nr:MAG: hypothetical protein D6775_13445 [Caldilineae bacterium]